ncbi:hypothetical protein CYMTET_34676 [Cymbomonas tetramitiformis]|uniref:Uncharacterized protein n=1 Tax=Cymbomonas tetramitiformis TaxID=36881 RepID=A0AAE0KPY4_9CHLO|nr:hypothetical protein CYMTET_34676 [Cymbomonas tetramitiformis]
MPCCESTAVARKGLILLSSNSEELSLWKVDCDIRLAADSGALGRNLAALSPLEDLVRRIMLQFPQGVTLRRFLRILDQYNHYFKDDPERLRALIERMPDLAQWISRETRPDIITPVSWRSLKEQRVYQDLRDHRVKALKKGIVPPEVMEIWFQEDVTLKLYE